VHTAFDVAAGGTADALAEVTGIEGGRGFGPLHGPDGVKIVTYVPADHTEAVVEAMVQAGAGSIGRYGSCSFRSEGIGTFLPSEHASPVAGSVGLLNQEPEVRVEMVAPARLSDAVVAALVATHPYEEPAYDQYESRSNAGFVGRYGPLGQPVRLASLAEMLEGTLQSAGLRIAGDPDAMINSAAVVPGSGSSFIGSAAALGANVIITGDVDHHRAVEALDRGIAVIDAGHAPTERPGMTRLYEAVDGIAEKTRDLTRMNSDPWGR
jgi:hypothetical protein